MTRLAIQVVARWLFKVDYYLDDEVQLRNEATAVRNDEPEKNRTKKGLFNLSTLFSKCYHV